MTDMILWILWGFQYILCVGLGFLPEATGFGKVLLILNALIFFIPGGVLLYRGIEKEKPRQVRQVRLACILSLSLTMAAIVANVLSAYGSQTVGDVLYDILVLVSAPMVCGQFWILSLFLWACLLMASFKKKPSSV